MPIPIMGAEQTEARPDLRELNFNYDYPLSSDGSMLNLKPGDPDGIHDFIRDRLMTRARAAHDAKSDRFASWDAIDDKLQCFIPLSEEEERIRSKDERKPVSVVVPTMFANLHTLCTYTTAAFAGESPMWPLSARNPESRIGTIKLEMNLEWQRQRMSMLTALYTQWRNAFAYGYGPVTPSWTREMGFQTVRKPKGFLNRVTGQFVQTGWSKARQEIVSFEGNRLDAINPRMYLPDPNAPVHDPDRAEYVGWMQRVNCMDLLSMEQYGGLGLFNCRYVRFCDGRSVFFADPKQGRNEPTNDEKSEAVNPVDIIWMHVKLIPYEWKLGPETYPERWLFGLAGDKIVVQAARLNLDHNMAPVAVCAPSSDGYSAAPLSILETGYGLQVFEDWMFSAKQENVRRSIYNQYVYDPTVINSAALRNPKSGGLIPTRRGMYGRDIKTAIIQMPTADVTRDHFPDVAFAMDLQQRIMGTTDIVQGIMRSGGERRSATEARGAREAALSRLQNYAQLISEQSMKRLGYLMAKQTQQLQSEEISIRITGRWEQLLAAEYGFQGYMTVNPFEILVDFDVEARDGSLPNGDNAQLWQIMFQTVASNPVLMEMYDLNRIFAHFARMAGATDVAAFQIPDIRTKVIDNLTLEAERQKGNIVPADEYAQAQKKVA